MDDKPSPEFRILSQKITPSFKVIRNRSSYNLAFKLKIVPEAEAVENTSEIAREYGISESLFRRCRKDQANLFNGELKMSAKRKMMGCYTPKCPELDQTLLEWFSEQRSQGKVFVLNQNQLIPVISIELPCLLKP